MRPGSSVSAVIWGLLFICIALAGVLLGFGILPDPAPLAFIGPVVLIGLGVFGLFASRKN